MDGNLAGDTFNALCLGDDWTLLDVGTINDVIEGVPTDSKVALFCLEGKNSYMAQNRMFRYGYKDVKVVEGGTIFNRELTEELPG